MTTQQLQLQQQQFDPVMTTKWHFPMMDETEQGRKLLSEVTISANALPDLDKFLGTGTAITTSTSDSDKEAAPAMQLRKILHEYGFAIVRDVLRSSPTQQQQQPQQQQVDEVSQFKQFWNEDLNSLIVAEKSDPDLVNRIKQDAFSNWPLDQMPLGAKFCSDWGIPQGRLAWETRLHPNVKKVFANIHGTPNLCVGTDVVFFNNVEPSAYDQQQQKGSNDERDCKPCCDIWPHSDQNRFIHPGGDSEVYQGLLYVTAATNDTSSTVVWPKSHKAPYDRLMKSRNWSHGSHYCQVRHDAVLLEEFLRNAYRVPVPAGALLLFSSSLLHQGHDQGKRLAVPVCMEPKERRSKTALIDKFEAIAAGAPTTHWASLGQSFSALLHRKNVQRQSPDGKLTIEHKAHLRLLVLEQQQRPCSCWWKPHENAFDNKRQLKMSSASSSPSELLLGLVVSITSMLPLWLGGTPTPPVPLPKCVVDLC